MGWKDYLSINVVIGILAVVIIVIAVYSSKIKQQFEVKSEFQKLVDNIRRRQKELLARLK